METKRDVPESGNLPAFPTIPSGNYAEGLAEYQTGAREKRSAAD